MMLKQKVNELENETVSQRSEAPAADGQRVDGCCDSCGRPLLPVPVKAVAIKSSTTAITQGKEYDIVKFLGDNIIIIDDTGVQVGFSQNYLKPIEIHE